MSKYACCEIIECVDACNIDCNSYINNCKKSCDEKICLCVCLNDKETIDVQISKTQIDSLIKQIKCKTHDHKYKIICAIVLGNIIYIFVQLGYNSKYNILCAIQ